MISTKKLMKMAKKWHRVAALKRKRISLPRASQGTKQETGNAPSVADKGHIVVYIADERLFFFPIAFLNNPIITELNKMSEKEFGLPSEGPIVLPCDAVFMEYIVSLIQKGLDRNLEKALLVSIASNRCTMSCFLHQEQNRQQLLVC